MAAKKNSEGLAYLVEALKKDKNLAYADAAEGAKKKGLTVYPIMFGKAKLMLGYVKAGAGKNKRAAAKAGRQPGRPAATLTFGPKRGPGRPRKNPGPDLGALDTIVSSMRQNQAEVERYRRAMQQIYEVLQSVS